MDTPSPPDARWANIGGKLANIGLALLRYGLVFILFLFGAQKWTHAEAEGIKAFVSNSPLFAWMYHVTSVQGASIVFGVFELLSGLLIALRRWFPLLCAVGSALAIGMFLSTLTFLITTPHMDASTQGFVLKDILSLGVAVWSTGEALLAWQHQRPALSARYGSV